MNSNVLLMTSVGTLSGITTALTLQGLKKLVALYNEPEGAEQSATLHNLKRLTMERKMLDALRKRGLCSICFEKIDEQRFWKAGHNAEPINEGRCCSICNDTKVIPARIQRMIA